MSKKITEKSKEDLSIIGKQVDRIKKEKAISKKIQKENGSLKPDEEIIHLDKNMNPPTPLLESLFRFVAIGLTVVPFLIGRLGTPLVIGDIITLMTMLSWTVFSGWMKKISESKVKYWYGLYKKEKNERDAVSKRLKTMTQQVDDMEVIKNKLQSAVITLTDQLTHLGSR